MGLGVLFVVVAGAVCLGLVIFKGHEESASDAGNVAEKEKVVEKEEPERAGEEELGKAEVRLVSFGADRKVVYAAGQVDNSTDDTGICRYVFTRTDGKVVEVTAEPMLNRGYIICTAVEKSIGEMGAGTWGVKLVYNSSMVYGESEEVEIEVR